MKKFNIETRAKTRRFRKAGQGTEILSFEIWHHQKMYPYLDLVQKKVCQVGYDAMAF